MRAHDAAGHEEALAALAGSADPRAAFARSPLAACRACNELVHLEQRLDALGSAERSELARALASPAPARGRAEEAARAEILSELGATRARPSSWWRVAPWLLAAAAVLALFGLRPWIDEGAGRDQPDRDPKLGPALTLQHPLGTVEGFSPFRWTAAGPEAGWYRVIVQPLASDGSAGKATDSGRILATSWEPRPEELDSWGDRIRWTLEVYRATGASDLVDSRSASAELSSR